MQFAMLSTIARSRAHETMSKGKKIGLALAQWFSLLAYYSRGPEFSTQHT